MLPKLLVPKVGLILGANKLKGDSNPISEETCNDCQHTFFQSEVLSASVAKEQNVE